MKNNLLSQALLLTYILIISCSYIKAQESSQKFEGLVIPEPGSSSSYFRDQLINSSLGLQRTEIIGDPSTILSTFTVTTTSDDGVGSFRDAITKANETSGADVINFNIPGTGIQTISPLSSLPDIIYPVIIDGTTQSGYTDKPLIEVDGFWAGPSEGIAIKAAGCTLKGIAINRFNGVGVALYFGQTAIEGCFLGLDPNGISNKGNLQEGVFILSANNTIGNPNGKRNVISWNDSSGIFIVGSNATGNKIQNTYIGTDYNGVFAAPNKLNGVDIYQSSQSTIGGSNINEMNVISGNLESGIRIEGGSSQQITIKGNRIGTNFSGSSALGNMNNGITIVNGIGSATGNPSNIIIGGKWAESQNLISGNAQAGIGFFLNAQGGGTGNIIAGNLIGTNYNGSVKIPNNHGIFIIRDDTTGSMPGIKIGGGILDSNNVISGNNQIGIWIKSFGARNNGVYGNYIGTTSPNTGGQILGLGNGFAGVYIDSASFNNVGDVSPLRGNVIGDNTLGGISIMGTPANGNSIYNNFIGTYLLAPPGVNIGNRKNGIYIEGSNTKVGGPGLMNEIANNYLNGIYVHSGTKNVLWGNSIYKNGSTGMGIDLAPVSITKNDSADLDIGPNLLQNFPILESAVLYQNSTLINGSFYSKPNTQFTLHFFKSNQKSPSHFGEGQFYLDSLNVMTNDSGWYFIENKIILEIVSDDQFITALAVDAEGNTSEFSRALCLEDSDGDGLSDCWETQGDGIDINADGLIDLDLWSRGARWYHKDIFVEVDFMKDFNPSNASMKMVKDAFAIIPNEYINNPDGAPGIKLHVEFGDTALTNEILLDEDPWPRFFELKRAHWGTFLERQHPNAKYLLAAKKQAYRYCLWGNEFGTEGYSGMGELTGGAGGNDFLVTLGGFSPAGGDSNQQAGTFMHELGHTLGLGHGGIDNINYKPNYYSVMNYAWQFPGTDSLSDLSWRLVYSNKELPNLNENNLNEAVGLNPPPRHYPDPILFPYNNGTTNPEIRIGILYPNTGVDWDGNGDSSGFASRPVDINHLYPSDNPSPGDNLIGYADLPNLKYNFRNSPNFRDPEPGLNKTNAFTEPEEMTPEIYDYLQSLPPYGVIPPIMVQASIKWLGTLGGSEGESIALGISDNGRVVVGSATDSAYDYQEIAFRWTHETGMQSLGNLGNNPNYSEATGISADGNIIVGFAYDDNDSKKSFRWTEATGMQDIGAGDYSEAKAISGDGTTIVGWGRVGDNIRAFIHKNGTVSFLGTLGGSKSYATAVSNDGSVVVGYSDNSVNNPYAFRWYAGEMQNIGVYYSFANGISGDGYTVTGFETWSGTYRAFRWSLFDGMQLNIVGNYAQGNDVTYDGEYIVGDGSNGAFRKSVSGQIEWYNQILADSLAPYSDLYSLTAISSDGRYAVGYGYNAATNRDEAFILDTGGRLITSVENNNIEKTIDTYYLKQNYPNPFNPVTTIRYNVKASSKVVIAVYNILGQSVITLVNEEKPAGTYEVKFNASGLASGIYLYRFQSGDFVETKKMILLK